MEAGFVCVTLAVLVGVPAAGAQTIPERMERALELLRAGERGQARAVLEGILEEEPSHGPAHLSLGRLAFESGDTEEAREHLLAAARSEFPGSFLAWHLLGRMDFEAGDDAGAKAAVIEALKRAPHFVASRILLGELEERQGRLWEALASYRRALDRTPGDDELPGLRARIARLARRMGALDLAECHARHAVRARPGDGYFRYLLAVVLEDAGNIDEALASCQRALELGFEEAPVYVTLGNLHYRKMRLSDSIASLGKALALDPAAAESIASFALTELTTEDYAALRSLLEKHVTAHPESPNTLYGLGAMYLREGKLDEAEATFSRLRKLAPGHAQVHYNLGLVYLRQGRRSESEAAMARFRELKAEEDEVWLRHNRAHAQRLEAREAASGSDWPRAISLYETLLRDRTAELADRVALGRALLEAGEAERALTTFEDALQSSPYQPDVLEGLAAAATALGRSDIARETEARRALLASPCSESSAR